MIVLSEAAIASDWVEDEVDKAFEKERQRGGIVLFPVRLLARLLRDLRIDAAGVAAKKRPPTTSGPVATAIPLILESATWFGPEQTVCHNGPWNLARSEPWVGSCCQIGRTGLGAYRWLIAALGQLETTAEACETVRQATDALAPVPFDAYATRHMPWIRDGDYRHLLDGLHKAGWNPPRGHVS